VRELADRLDSPTTFGGTPAMAVAVAELETRVRNALFDDLNAPQALAAVFNFVHAAHADLDRKGSDRSMLDQAARALAFIEQTLGIVPNTRPGGLVGATAAERVHSMAGAGVGGDAARAGADTTDEAALRSYVEERLQARQAARARRDFATADAIRAELQAKGVTIADTGAGTSWKSVR